MIWTPWFDTRVRAAAIVAVAAVMLLLNETRLALRADVVVPVAARAPFAPVAPRPNTAQEPAPLGALFGIGTGVGRASESAPAPATSAPLTLIGTVVGSDAPAAVCQRGTDAPRILHLGDTLGGWRLQQVAPAAAIFIDAAGVRHELRLSPSGN